MSESRNRIDIGSIIPYSRRSDAVTRMRRRALAVKAHWANYARKHLGSTSRDYQRGLLITHVDSRHARIELRGTIPNLIEQGMGPSGIGSEGPYDLRVFLLRPTTKSIRGKPGALYLHVPFDHTEESIRSAGVFSGPPNVADVLREIRSLDPTVSRNGQTAWGGRLPAGRVRKLAPHHATDPFAGMVRLGSTYSAAAGQGGGSPQYRTWRTLSQAGKPWIANGPKARRFAERTIRELPMILDRM